MSKRTGNTQWMVILIIVVAIIAIYLTSYSSNPIGLVAGDTPTLNSGHPTTTTGNPGWINGPLYCRMDNSGSVVCKDAQGNVVPYHCGDIFIVSRFSSSTNHQGYCNVNGDCANAMAASTTAASSFCAPQVGCNGFTETGTITAGGCKTVGNDTTSSCRAHLYGKCT